MLNSKKKIVVIICILLIVFIFSIIFAIINMGNDTILKGISINGIDVSKMTKQEAVNALTKLTEEKINTEVGINYNQKTEEETNIDIASLEINYDINDIVDEAYNIGRINSIFINNFDIINTYINKKDLKMNISLNEESLNQTIDSIDSNLPDKLIQTSYYIEDKNLIITRGTPGNVLKVESLKENIYKYLEDLTSKVEIIDTDIEYVEPDEIDIQKIHEQVYKKPQNAYYEEKPFKVYKDIEGIDFDIKKAQKQIDKNPNKTEYKIALKFIEAKVKLEDLDVDIFKDILSQHTTRYDPGNANRENNLKLAASKINGTILSPGEEFSYNTVVGERSIAAGYKEAKIYAGGKVVDGLGGGICQVSSTLYNAVIFANLEVTERHNHQFVTSYIEAGRDATVAYGSKDFKFKNNRTYPIKIKAVVKSGIAKVEILGIKEKKEPKVSFRIRTVSTIPFKTQYEDDNTLEEGKEKKKQGGMNGIIVKVYKIVEQNGKTVSEELISQDTYNALTKIILKGTKKTSKKEDKKSKDNKTEENNTEENEILDNEIEENKTQ